MTVRSAISHAPAKTEIIGFLILRHAHPPLAHGSFAEQHYKLIVVIR